MASSSSPSLQLQHPLSAKSSNRFQPSLLPSSHLKSVNGIICSIMECCKVEAKKDVPGDDQNILNRSSGSIHGSHGPRCTRKIFAGGLALTVRDHI
ncbi:heterogeneous nuclear ribonucleoprotein 1 [Senna tora]|uniref:Heterogeneous nuclear ribonucleoprotein 1 n=1 Tax=Senna tora TaxID=362788 RepID=A0A834SR63_9FABA|nr:heterogeneous nuclear ribonucleoprotein 1 [Senna tora]